MSDPVLFDAAFAGPDEPRVNGCIFYGGGDTPHVWTMAEILAAPGQFRLFCWVRSNPAQVNAAADTGACLNALSSIGYPKGKAVLLDLETAVDQAYVDTFGQALHGGGYLVWDYGSTSTLFRNPALDGYFPSDPTGVDHIQPGWVGCQFSFNGSYDLDDIAEPGLLWDLGALPQTAKELDDMNTLIGKDWEIIISGIRRDNNNNAVMRIPRNPDGSFGTPQVIDVTDGIHAANPGDVAYQLT